jgi:2-oxoisovalerate dehydrogenase E1 component
MISLTHHDECIASLSDLLCEYNYVIKQALTIRMVEQRLLDEFQRGNIAGTIHTCIGQEFIGMAVAKSLQAEDYVFSNHRNHGHFLAMTDNLEGLVAEVMGKTTGVCAGRGGSQHLHQGHFFSSGVQGGLAPVAAGVALAQKIARSSGISILFIGDGTLGQGVLYETLNIISKWDLPLLIVLENNLYAQSTPQSQTLAGDIADRFAAFGIETAHSDTWNWPDLIQEIDDSVYQVRQTCRPRFHQIDTWRIAAHSKGDDHRPADEIQQNQQRDPINLILRENADHPWLIGTLNDIQSRIDLAVVPAQQAPSSKGIIDLSSSKNVFTSSAKSGDNVGVSINWQPCLFPREKIAGSIRSALEHALANHNKVILMGEDIESPYGGAFKATAGLSDQFPGRVLNTPISEAGIAGLGNGLALAGMTPVVEIMFGDFCTLIADQWINQASKLKAMYQNDLPLPLIIRTPMGGRRGYGPTHSQSLEKHFLGVPGTQVLCLHHRYSPFQLYNTLFATIDRPTLVIENKVLYGQYSEPTPPTGFQLLRTTDDFPWICLKPAVAPEITLVALGGIALEAEQALVALFEKYEIVVELFCPTRLYPLDVAVLHDSLAQTRRLLVAEEGQGFVSLAGEIIAQAAQRWPMLALCCDRVTARSCVIPAARNLEQQCLPDAQCIVEKALELIHAEIH